MITLMPGPEAWPMRHAFAFRFLQGTSWPRASEMSEREFTCVNPPLELAMKML